MSATRPRQPLRPAGGPAVGGGTPRALRPYLNPPGVMNNPNPGGQPKRQRSVAKAIREMLSHDPTGLVCLLLDIAEDHTARDSDRINAIRELLDRGYGKAPEHAPIQDGDPLEMGELETAIHDIIHRRREFDAKVVTPTGELPAGEDSGAVGLQPPEHAVEVGEREPELSS